MGIFIFISILENPPVIPTFIIEASDNLDTSLQDTTVEQPSISLKESISIDKKDRIQRMVVSTDSYDSSPISKSIYTTAIKRKTIDKKAMSNVKVVVAKLKNDYLLKLGIDIPPQVLQRHTNSKKREAKPSKDIKTTPFKHRRIDEKAMSNVEVRIAKIKKSVLLKLGKENLEKTFNLK